ncbi:MAG: MarR family transcriptional regulator [Thermoplasmataceae archaeon]
MIFMDCATLDLHLSGSALKVLNVLSSMKIARFEDLKARTGLPKRTLLYSIRVLRDAGIVETQICMSDARRRFYCVKLGSIRGNQSINEQQLTDHL